VAINVLTDQKIRKAKHGDSPPRLSDGDGLYIELHPNGSKYWRMKYRFGGREKRLAFGVYPEVTLKEARQRRDEARRLLAAKTDPGEVRKAEKAAGAAKAQAEKLTAEGKALPGTFEAVAREWLTSVHEKKVSAGHSERTRIRLEQDVFPWIGPRPMAEIGAPELLACLRRVTARGAIETAHRIKHACGQVFRFGIASGHCDRNPAADLREALPPVPPRHHAAIVDPTRAGDLLRAMLEYKGHPVTRAALALAPLLFLRPGEIRQLEWAWVDLDGAIITIPSTLMKRRTADKVKGAPHLVPLAPQAVAILHDLHKLTGHGGYLFPSLLTGERPMSENTVNTALRRMGFSRDEMTAHGFRAMARTMAAERLNIEPEVIEAQLAHAVPDALGRAYNRTQFLDQRRELMRKWAEYVYRLREGAQVIQFQPAAGR
jgi:integrase